MAAKMWYLEKVRFYWATLGSLLATCLFGWIKLWRICGLDWIVFCPYLGGLDWPWKAGPVSSCGLAVGCRRGSYPLRRPHVRQSQASNGRHCREDYRARVDEDQSRRRSRSLRGQVERRYIRIPYPRKTRGNPPHGILIASVLPTEPGIFHTPR